MIGLSSLHPATAAAVLALSASLLLPATVRSQDEPPLPEGLEPATEEPPLPEGLGEETARLLVEKGLIRQLPDLFDLKAEQLIDLGIVADRIGYDSYWFTEHHFQYEGYEVTPNAVLLGTWLAAHTSQIRLGALFNIVLVLEPHAAKTNGGNIDVS